MEDSPLAQGIALFKSGQKQLAAILFTECVTLEPLSETGWLWMAACAESVTEKRSCLLKVLEINPQQEKARKALLLLEPGEEPALTDITGGVSSAPAQDAAGAVKAVEIDPAEAMNARINSVRELNSLLEIAQMAEQNHEYQQMYALCTTALELDNANQTAWIGKGIAAGMVATFHKTNTLEVKQCLWDKVLIRGRSGITRDTFLDGVDARALKRIIDGFTRAGNRLVEIQESIDLISEKSILRVFELDRESLSLYDCAYFLTRFQPTDYQKRPDWRDLVQVTRGVLQRITYGINTLSQPPEKAAQYIGLALNAFTLSKLGSNERFLNEIGAK